MSAGRPVKFYTRARKFPRLLGKTLDGRTLPGGPYSIRQAVVAGVVLFVMAKTISWWGGSMSGVSRGILIVAAVLGSTVVTRNLPTFPRNPLSLLLGLLRVITSPSRGRYRNRAITIPAGGRVRGAALIDDSPAEHHRLGEAPPPSQPDVEPEQLREELPFLDAGTATAAPRPAGVDVAPAPTLSRVSSLLAAAASNTGTHTGERDE